MLAVGVELMQLRHHSGARSLPTGRPGWSRRTSGTGCGSSNRLRGPRAAHGRDPGARWRGGRGVFLVKKETTKGKEHEYWHVAWMIECKVRGMYLGIARKLDAEVARQKAREDEGRSFGKYMVRRPEHHACSHIGAHAREGLSPGVPGGRSGLVSGGLSPRRGGVLRWILGSDGRFFIIGRKL